MPGVLPVLAGWPRPAQDCETLRVQILAAAARWRPFTSFTPWSELS